MPTAGTGVTARATTKVSPVAPATAIAASPGASEGSADAAAK